MGTRLEVLILGIEEKTAILLWQEIQEEILRLDRFMNKFDEESELSLLNKQAYVSPIQVGKELWDIITDCCHHYERTLGYFDITMGNHSSLLLDKSTRSISFSTEGMSFDLGGYGKGYALKRIGEILHKKNIEQSLVNFGNSSVLAIGTHPYGDFWPIGISDPFTETILGTIHLKDNSLSTSGNSPNNRKHILNPHTNTFYQGKDIISVCSSNPVICEVLSTALVCASEEDRKDILSRYTVDDFHVFHLA